MLKARPFEPVEPAALALVDPENPMCEVLPPILDEIARCAASGEAGARRLGDIYSSGTGSR